MKPTKPVAPTKLADYHRALDLVAQERHQEAIPPLRRCLAQEPGFVDARFLLCRIHRRFGRYEEALEVLEECSSSITNDGEALAEAAEVALFAGEERRALRLAEAAAKRAPRLDSARFLAVLMAFVARGPMGALRVVKRHLKERPTWGPGYSLLGSLEEALGHFAAAEQAYQNAVEIDPSDTSTLEHLKRLWRGEAAENRPVEEAFSTLFVEEGRRLASAGLMAKSLEAVEEWSLRFPERLELLEILVNACLDRAHPKKALDFIRRVPKERMTFPVLFLKARALCAMGDFERAAELYDLLCRESPPDSEAWVGLVRTLLDSGNIPAAEEAVEKGLEQIGGEARLWYLRAVLHKEAGRAELSLAALERTVELYPRYKEALFALGSERLEQGLGEEAIPPLGDVVALDSGHLEGWRHLAIAHTRCRHWDEALDAWMKVREFQPDDPQAAQNIPRLRLFLKNPPAPPARNPKGRA